MKDSWFPLALAVMLMAMGVIGMVFGVRGFIRRQSSPSHQKSRQIAQMALGPTIIGIIIMLYLGTVDPRMKVMTYLMCLPLIIVALRFVWLILHEPTEGDAVENFAHDREHCGKCGYSVTGNVTGICPECGWVYPIGELTVEESDWSAWWRKWRIKYLRHTLWHLSSYLGIGSFCLAMAAVFWAKDDLIPAVMIALLGIHLSINAIRVIDYLRRRN